MVRTEQILVFLYAGWLDGLHDEEAYQKILGILNFAEYSLQVTENATTIIST